MVVAAPAATAARGAVPSAVEIAGVDSVGGATGPAVISQHLDLTLLYADWTCQEINSLTHSYLVVLILFL